MQKSKKIVFYFSILIVLIIMVSLFYYSMRETLLDYLFQNDQALQEKITSATGDQAQIMVDLANKQLAKQNEETEIRADEKKNKSLFKETNGNNATVKKLLDTPADNSSVTVSVDAPVSSVASDTTAIKENKVQNGFVVVDCETGGVIACPHYDVQAGTSPLFYRDDKSHFVVGRCLDVSIDVKTFCP